MKFLKKAKGMHPEHSVKYLLHQHLTGFSPGRSYKRVHASSLTKPQGFCPRMYALADVTSTPARDEWLSTSQLMTFQIGRDQEKNIVLWFAEMGRAVCHWKCTHCGQTQMFQRRPKGCPNCNGGHFVPEEVRFTSALTGASAGVDMIAALGDPKMRPVELKTMDKDKFKDLIAPLAEHRWRTNLYLRIMAESELPWANMIDLTKASILYVSKGGFGTLDPEVKKWGLSDSFSPFKEYVVERNDADTDDICNRAKVVKDFREEKVPMPHGICSSALVPRAKECPLKSVCFSGDHPPHYDWNSK